MAPNMREDGVRNILRMILWCLVLSREKWSGRTTFRCLKRSDPGPLLVVPPEKRLYIDAEKQLGADKQLREEKQLGADKQQGVDLHSNKCKHLSLSLAKRLPVVVIAIENHAVAWRSTVDLSVKSYCTIQIVPSSDDNHKQIT